MKALFIGGPLDGEKKEIKPEIILKYMVILVDSVAYEYMGEVSDFCRVFRVKESVK